MVDSGDASAEGREIGKEDSNSALKESAIRSVLRSFQDFMPYAASQYATYENAFFNKVKDGLMKARKHPAESTGIVFTAGLLFLPRSRRFLFRQTLGRFQSKRAQFARAEKDVNSFRISVGLMKRESEILLGEAASAEKEVKDGIRDLKLAGDESKRLAKTVRKLEVQTADLMDELRDFSGEDALKLQDDVAALASILKERRISIDKQIMKIAELGIPV